MIGDTINDAATVAGGEGALLAGRYRIVKQLGQGGMGSVWLAEDTHLDSKLFAIKMLPSVLVSNRRAYRQLKDEALVAMKLTHPNIVTLRAFEEDNGNPFLVMDYIEGQTLDDYIAEHTPPPLRGTSPVSGEESSSPSKIEGGGGAAARGSMTGCLQEEEVIRILKPIADALDYAHKKGVVHRDVKPGNVMIASDGTPYILDFGIAREIQETMTRVTGKLSSGTLLYMSPEQLRGLPPKPAQDVYSFAAMVYECMAGHPPFYRGAIEDQIKNEQPEPLEPHIAISGLVTQGLSKNPEDRPSTCMAVLDARSPVPRRVAEPRSNGVGKAFAFLLLLAALGAGGYYGWVKHDEALREKSAEVERIRAERNEAENKLREEAKRIRREAEERLQAERKAREEREKKAAEERIRAEKKEAEDKLREETERIRREAEERLQAERKALEEREKELAEERARQQEGDFAAKTMEEGRCAIESPDEIGMQCIACIPFDQDMNYERCSNVVFAPVYFPKGVEDSQLVISERYTNDAVAQELLNNPDLVVIVTGHCDEGVSNEFGLSVGEYYACIIRDNLVSAGVNGKRIQTRSYGTEKPAVVGSNEKNNRAEFEIFRRKTSQQVDVESKRLKAKAERQSAPSAEVKAIGDGRSFSSASVTTDYIVQRGDYFAKISKRFNVKPDDLRKANPQLKNDVVMIGQKIVIPRKVDVGEYTVPEGTLKKPYKREYEPYSGPTKDYTVKAGDSLGGIAYGNGVNIRQLKELNGLTSDVLRVGQRLKIPAGQQHHGTGVVLLDDL